MQVAVTTSSLSQASTIEGMVDDVSGDSSSGPALNFISAVVVSAISAPGSLVSAGVVNANEIRTIAAGISCSGKYIYGKYSFPRLDSTLLLFDSENMCEAFVSVRKTNVIS